MVVITGAAGFIGSVVAGELNNKGRNDLVLVDDFSKREKERNFINLKYDALVARNDFFTWFKDNHVDVDFVVHLGARTDTTEFDWNVFQELNVDYTKTIFSLCADYQIPMVYASSAATYGDGELGYDDSHEVVERLQPLNPYGRSKNEVDKWILKQQHQPPFWAGLKFFNVYGPNEYHKGRMASVIFHSFNQIKATGKVKLFRSHRPDFADGQQLRDFIYVKDIASVIYFMISQQVNKSTSQRVKSGLYNLGTGKARSFYDLAANTFKAMGKDVDIEFIDIPEDIRDKYQYFTEANMTKLREAGYDKEFTSLEDGVMDYVKNYLMLLTF
ncbi:MAG: ADP-glyceromanno-heptose 6-epimerase [Lentimicrobiaceae bacterium]|nr:ADP-glyceromanno-heptose 6-epimerase [Lentimicrobiaceae bacterium]